MTKGKKLFFIIFACVGLLVASCFVCCSANASTTASLDITGTISFVGYNITATDIGANTATITWKTNGAANSAVEYGLTTGYGSTSTDDVMNTSHTIQLIGLSVPKEYHYRVISKMIDGQSYTSPDATFKTVYAAGTTVATKTAGTTVTGVTTKTIDGAQQVNISTSTSTQVSGNTVTVTNPGNGWSSMQYTGTKVTTDGTGTSIDGIQGVVMKSDPVKADLGGDIGTVSTQINVPLTQQVSGVSIQQNVIMGASTSATNAFQLAATSSNLDVKSVAYTVEFLNTGDLNAKLGSAGVTLDLSVEHAWVVANAPNGDRNNIRIMRFADDGRKEVLDTQYTRSDGTIDFFTAKSYHGLSIFGMVATSSGGGGGSGGGSSSDSGSSGGGSSSDSSGGLLGLITGQKSDQKSSPPVEPPVIQRQAPRDENAPTTTRSLAIAGLTVTPGSAGKQTLHLDTARAEQSGTIVSVSGNVITLNQPGFTITVVTRDTPVKENGVISGTVQSVRLHTAPAYADTSTGIVSISVDTPLATIPENAAITTTISETANPGILDAFRSAAQSQNQQVKGIAYNAYITKTNFVPTGPATVTLTIPPDWVTNHGGIPSIGIAHISDEGTASILRTDYTGYDNAGNMVFQATSPQGLSLFSLISLENLTGPAQVQVKTLAPSSSSQPSSERIQSLGGIMRFILNNIVLVIAGCIILLAIGISVILYDLRSHKKNKQIKKKEK
jgi:hypothetical protein